MTDPRYHVQREPLLCGDGLTLEDTRFETVRLARRCNGLASDLEAALERRDHWFREREGSLDEIQRLQKQNLRLRKAATAAVPYLHGGMIKAELEAAAEEGE